MRGRAHNDRGGEVLLACMPFGILPTPSLALGLLKASLAQSGVPVPVQYFSFLLAQMVGVEAYQKISKRQAFGGYHETGEWIFAESLFPGADLDPNGYMERILRRPSGSLRRFLYPLSEEFIATVLHVKSQVEPFLDRCLAELESIRPRILGFSCLFQQKLASLSLARRVKATWPETFILFGGPDCEGVRGVEMVRQFPFVDAVVSGEADTVLPEIVRRVFDGKPLAGIRGVYAQGNSSPHHASGPCGNTIPVPDLNQLPCPEFDDYFEQLHSRGLASEVSQYLSLETSRGCWWGEKEQCVFCGLNGADLSYRSKSPGRVVEEIVHISRRYPTEVIVMTDSVLDMRYFKECIPTLAAQHLGLQIQYETRSSLTRKQIGALRDAGITRIQPGIESLSTPILKLMRKGTTMLQNIQCLKWAQEMGLLVFWNLLLGTPGESPEEYSAMVRLVPLLTHLPPPHSVRQLEVGRFSPLFERGQEFGLKDIAPSPAYHYIYPMEPDAVANLATYFTYQYRDSRDVGSYAGPVRRAVQTWTKVHARSKLLSLEDGRRLFIWDQRPVARRRLTVLTGLRRRLYLACDGIRSLRSLQRGLEQEAHRPITSEKLRRALASLMSAGLMIRERQRFLSLGIPATRAERRGALKDAIAAHMKRTRSKHQTNRVQSHAPRKEPQREMKAGDLR